MSEQLQRAVQFANPVSGEVLHLGSPDADLLGYLADIREFESVLREHKRMVSRELAGRRDKIGKWSWTAGDYKASVPSPAPTEEWNGGELRDALLEFVDRDVLAIEAVDAAVEVVVDYKVKRAGVEALRKLGAIRDVIDRLAKPVEKRERSVKIERLLP